jgi:hypothetical protein
MSHHLPRSRYLLALCAFTLLATAASARVISYAPYSDRPAYPAQQHRMNRFFVLMEGLGSSAPILAPYYSYPTGQLVMYDSKGEQEPRVVLPQDNSVAAFSVVAVRENNGVPVIFTQTNAVIGGKNSERKMIFALSTDGGSSWKIISGLPDNGYVVQNIGAFAADTGGPITHNQYSQVRIGTASTPFVLSFYNGGIFSVAADGTVRQLVGGSSTNAGATLVGSDISGSVFLYRQSPDTLSIVDLAGNKGVIGIVNPSATDEGWITPNGDVYLHEWSGSQTTLARFHDGVRSTILSQTSDGQLGMFAIPTFDFTGAWIIQRGQSRPTTLFLHDATGLHEQWSDVTAPEVEALHAGSSGKSLLVQVHRPRPQTDQRIFKDPALAIWHVGEREPRVYDELFMDEQYTKGFVHLDVEAVAKGEPFVFDSGATSPPVGIIISPSIPVAGGGDVVQEWGVVRASLSQKLILPGIGRTPGAYNSYWLSDVILYNPLDAAQEVVITYVPTGTPSPAVSALYASKLTLAPHEIRVIPDALKTIFNIDNGGGAFILTPESGINASSRTYTRSDKGTYGFGMNAIDYFAGSASPRFPVTFAGAFPGSSFRTNLILTDVSGHGSETALTAVGLSGFMGASAVPFEVRANGQQQINGISASLSLFPSDTGGLLVQPTRGAVVASVIAIDNRTNDPTYFPPDLPSPIVRTIPAIGHLDGANNAKFRSDLYLYNPSGQTRNLILQVKPWDSAESPQTINFTMLPNEARVIPDVLFRLFGRTGIARLRYQSSGDPLGVRVTSRTYTVDENGGTYGFLMPPLNNFQSATTGDTLEILGVVGGSQFRTNIGLVELTAFPAPQQATARIEIIDEKGKTIDAFTVNVPSAGGMQVNDVFHARGLGDGPAAALIRVTPLSGMVGAYATINDNGTNDPTYLAANLAAKQ